MMGLSKLLTLDGACVLQYDWGQLTYTDCSTGPSWEQALSVASGA